MDIGFLTDKYGPLPGWGWGALGVGGFVGYRWWRNRSAAASSATAPAATTTDSSTPSASTDLSSLPPASGGGGTASSGGGGSDTTGTTSDTTGFATGPPPPPDGFAYDQNGNLQPLALIEGTMAVDTLTQLAAEGLTLSNGQVVPIGSADASGIVSPSAPSVPAAPEQAPAAPEAPAPAPSTPPPPPLVPISTNPSQPAAHAPATPPPPTGLAARYGSTFTGTANQNNVVASFLRSHYAGTTLNDNLHRVQSDPTFAASVYAAALRNSA